MSSGHSTERRELHCKEQPHPLLLIGRLWQGQGAQGHLQGRGRPSHPCRYPLRRTPHPARHCISHLVICLSGKAHTGQDQTGLPPFCGCLACLACLLCTCLPSECACVPWRARSPGPGQVRAMIDCCFFLLEASHARCQCQRRVPTNRTGKTTPSSRPAVHDPAE